MAFKYCKSCGAKTQYLGVVPKFCSSCGESFSGSSSASIQAERLVRKNPIKREVPSEKLNEDETDVDYVPNIASLSYDVSPFDQKTFKAEELFNLPEDKNGGTSEEKTRKT